MIRLRLALLLIIFLLGNFSTPTFASMGSTGGGHTGGSHLGGGGSTVGSLTIGLVMAIICYTLLYTVLKRTTNLNRKLIIMLGLIGGCSMIVLISGFSIINIALFLCILPDLNKGINSSTPAKSHKDINSSTQIKSQHDLLLQQNQAPSDFERHLKLDMHIGAPKENSDIMQHNYAKAQYLYGNLIRQYVAGNHDLSSLKEYLAEPFYHNMIKEIKLKASQQTIDDVIVNKTVINRWTKYDDLTLIQITAYGNDSENQANSNFDSSFSRKTWTDYVVFDQDLKIVNLIYGEHFHLNGQDFNNDPGLSKGKYKEHDLRNNEHDMFK